MEIPKKHISFAMLADLAEGRATAAERTAWLAHIDSCQRCASEYRNLDDVIMVMRADDSEDPPRDVLVHAIKLFRAKVEKQPQSLVRRIIAALNFDSLTVAPAYGLRSGQSRSRQLLYSAEECELDLRVTEETDGIVVSGQVLSDDCSQGQVAIEGESGGASTTLNDLCEFKLAAVPQGSYALRLRFADVEVEIPQLELQI